MDEIQTTNPDLKRVTRSQRVTDADDNPTKANSAVALALAGAPYDKIAQVLEYASADRARQVVHRALAESAESAEDRDRLRFKDARRLDLLLQSVWSKATNPDDPQHLEYNRRAHAIVDRNIKLFGLDAPQRVEVYTPRQQEIEAFLTHATAALGANPSPEADIVDAEIVEITRDVEF